MNNMFENKWTFEPIEKFMWIYLIISCKYESRALKYLLNSPFFSSDLITKKDKYGYSPLYHAVCNTNLDISILKDYLTIENLGEMYFNSNVLINYAIKNHNGIKYIIENVDINKIDYSLSKYNPLLLACAYDEELIDLILSKNTSENNMISLCDHNDYTCLTYSLIYTPNKFKNLIESELCIKEIFCKHQSNFGNILLLSLKINSSFSMDILNSNLMDSCMFDDQIKYKSGMTTNIFMEVCKNIELFENIITNKYFNGFEIIMNDTNLLIE